MVLSWCFRRRDGDSSFHLGCPKLLATWLGGETLSYSLWGVGTYTGILKHIDISHCGAKKASVVKRNNQRG